MQHLWLDGVQNRMSDCFPGTQQLHVPRHVQIISTSLDRLRLTWHGSPQQAHMAADWFHKLGYMLPYGTNVADFILDLASGAILLDERYESRAIMFPHICMQW